ncbi:hypothetical protein [Microbacterium sp. H6]|uniref:hypothetical protein n=1 Tax=Microbacterium sp. H6 TaxID=421122 RepID=UPI000DE452EE|nr:hypothetical protein [Microbacterium sp. H6]RBO72836.1 hypothetical protein DSP71_08910 [Microbacterium sp. H6]
MSDLEWYHYPEQYGHLLEQTKDHELVVLHEDGLYRHLRFKAPGTSMWHWDVITWPGSLAIRGDIGEGFIFTRTQNMLRFFDQGQAPGWINADYWAEKLDRGSRSVKEFSSKSFRDWLQKAVEDRDDAAEIMSDAEDVDYDHEAIDLLNDHRVDWDSVGDWQDYEYHFILALHAILWGAKKYHESKATT